jgi:1-deoxy-D-xylulose-5-phosphate synthase
VPLADITSPAQLRALDEAALDALAGEIRTAIIAAVAQTGGHLGSNLGVVELTIALHRVFESPRDRIVWDTGHQAYVHKMLTGRTGQFNTLRQQDGLSGYPARNESEHDIVENSHASTALSWVAGLQVAHNDPNRRIIGVIGDGALTGGMAYEALNNIGHHELPVIIVLNDNGRSYAETVSRLSKRVAEIRTDPRFRHMRDQFDRVVARVPFAERVSEASIDALKTVVSDAPALQSFVEALGVRYLGPFDGHDINQLETALGYARRLTTPVLVHVLTEKGKGYKPAEEDPEKRLHDTSAFDPETGQALATSGVSWTSVFSKRLTARACDDPNIIALTAAMPGSTGLLQLADERPAQVFDVGIAEQHATTMAAGLAHAGKTPVFAVYSTFFARAFDQANFDVGLHNEHVVFAIDRAGITGDDGPSHHGVLDMALALRIPNMTVLAPSNDRDLESLIDTALDLKGPALIRFPKGAAVTAATVGADLPRATGDVSARKIRHGDDVCILAIGDRVVAALEAADLLAKDGINAAVWDVVSIRPADQTMLADAAGSPFVVTVENGVVSGGAGATLCDAINDLCGVRHAPPMLRLGVPAAYLPHGKPGSILTSLGLDGPGITARIVAELSEDLTNRAQEAMITPASPDA